MTNPEQVMWAVAFPDGEYLVCRQWEDRARKACEQMLGRPWDELEKQGYQTIRVSVMEVGNG